MIDKLKELKNVFEEYSKLAETRMNVFVETDNNKNPDEYECLEEDVFILDCLSDHCDNLICYLEGTYKLETEDMQKSCVEKVTEITS